MAEKQDMGFLVLELKGTAPLLVKRIVHVGPPKTFVPPRPR